MDLHEEAGKENEQTLANLSPAEETTDKDEVEVEKFFAGKQIKLFMFLFLCFLVWPYNKNLINRARTVCMGES